MLTPVQSTSKKSTRSAVSISEPVAADDLDAILSQMEIGERYTFADVYVEYASLAESAGRTPAHFVPFSKAIADREGVHRIRLTASVHGTRKQVRGLVRAS